MTDDTLPSALTFLRDKRDEHVAEVKRLTQAISAIEAVLAGDEPPSPNSVNGNGGSSATSERPSVRVMALRLMEEADRDWSVPEILDEYERRGTPIVANDPDNALRAAVAEAHKKGQMIRTAVGRYKAKKWEKPTSPSVLARHATNRASIGVGHGPAGDCVTAHIPSESG